MNENYKFIIAGTTKGGTTALIRNICLNSDFQKINNVTKSWLVGGDSLSIPEYEHLCGQAPYLMYVPSYIRRFYNNFPNVKIIICLRSPCLRAYSHYNHLVRKKYIANKSFYDLISDEVENRFDENREDPNVRRYHLVQKGFYYDQLKELFKYYSKERVHVVIQERMLKNTEQALGEVFDFLEVNKPLDLKYLPKKVSKYKEMRAIEKGMLIEAYKEPNENLFNLLGYRISEWVEKDV